MVKSIHRISILFVASLFINAKKTMAALATPAFRAVITPLSPDASSVSGTAVVYAHGSTVAFAGVLQGAPANLTAPVCTAKNGCGVHVHEGFACTNSTTQGGHYYNTDSDAGMDDPWLDVRYESDEQGGGTFAGILDVGETATLEGRSFLVHAQDGSRIGCGILEPVPSTLTVDTEPLPESSVTSQTTLVPLSDGTICFYGSASSLEPSLQSFLTNESSTNCTAKNGCGIHVHSGTGCGNNDEQGGHLYDGAVDPWLLVGYTATDATGSADFVSCVAANVNDYEGRPFVVHANDGSRVSCGLIQKPVEVVPGEEGNATSASAKWGGVFWTTAALVATMLILS